MYLLIPSHLLLPRTVNCLQFDFFWIRIQVFQKNLSFLYKEQFYCNSYCYFDKLVYENKPSWTLWDLKLEGLFLCYIPLSYQLSFVLSSLNEKTDEAVAIWTFSFTVVRERWFVVKYIACYNISTNIMLLAKVNHIAIHEITQWGRKVQSIQNQGFVKSLSDCLRENVAKITQN